MQSQQFSHSLFRVPSSQSSYLKSQQQSVHHTKYQQRSSTASSYFKQLQGNQQAKKLKEVSSELESKSGERLTALHSKLQQEAEKIRKWKNATEVEIKQKDKCLEEAHQKIESQSKSLTDLQLKNESLSSRLREEVANQREIQQKIASTRDMCTALKNHSVQVDEALCKGQYDKEQLLETDRARMIQFQKLLEKFQVLEGNQIEWEKLQNDAINAERKKNASLTNTCEQLREQLDEAHSKIASLEGQCADHRKCIEQLKEQVQDKGLQCDQLSKEKANLEHALCVHDSEASQLEVRMDDLQRQLTQSQSQLAEKEQLLVIAQDAIKQNEAMFNEKLVKMESTLSAEQHLKEDLILAKHELATKLHTVEETLTAECGKLRTEIDEANVQLEASYRSCANLEQFLASEKSEKEVILKEKETLSCQLVDLGEVMETMSKEIKEKDDSIVAAQASLTKSQSEFEVAQAEWKENQAQLHEQIGALESDKARLEAQTSQLSSQLHETQSNLEQQERSSKQGANKFQECIESLKNSKQERETEIAGLKARLETLTKNETELTSRCSELDQLKEENKRLQESLTTQLSHSKGLQNELSDLRSQMKLQTGELSELIEKYKKEASNAAQERDDAKKAYDTHVNELCSTMQRYSTENEKMVQQREKSITALKQQLEDTEKAKEASQSKLDEARTQLEHARLEVTVKSEEIKELLKAVECMQSKPSCVAPATPRRSATTPLTSSTPLHSITPHNPVLESPKYPAYNNSYTTPNKLGQHPKITTTTTNIPSTPAAPTNNDSNSVSSARVPSTPSRMYNYRVCSLPRSSSKNRPPPSTPKNNRSKRMKYQSEEGEEKVLPDTMMEDDETIFKKPKTPRVTSNVTVRKASTTSSGACTTTVSSSARQPSSVRKPLKNRNSRVYGKQKTVGKMISEENLSWFDTDSVFSFGPND